MTGTHADKSLHKGFHFPWPFPKKASFMYRVKSYLTMGFVYTMSKIVFIGGANKLIVHNKERFIKQWRDRTRPMITITNHRCNIDDPLMWNVLNWKDMIQNIDRHRYTLAASDICFTKLSHTKMFSLGRCVPCVRGAGVYQEGMNFCVEQLNQNQWVHIFPEGRVTMDPHRFKWGVGRLIMDSVIPPVIIPIWCDGMKDVWPLTPPYYPKYGHTVNVYVGEPFDTAALKSEAGAGDSGDLVKRKAITDVMQEKLYLFAEELGKLPKGTAARIARENQEIKVVPPPEV